jgi:hypothetical protein
LHIPPLIQNFDSCNLMSKNSDVLSCLIVSQYIFKIVKMIYAHSIYS